jgi:hypothetical protein
MTAEEFARHVASLLGWTNVPPLYVLANQLGIFTPERTDHYFWPYADECELCYHTRKALPRAWPMECRCNQRDAA